MSKPYNFEKLKNLLEAQESFPTVFVHKLVGLNSVTFQTGIQSFVQAHESMSIQSTRFSANQKHVSYTLGFKANSAEEIVKMIEASQSIDDLLIIL